MTGAEKLARRSDLLVMATRPISTSCSGCRASVCILFDIIGADCAPQFGLQVHARGRMHRLLQLLLRLLQCQVSAALSVRAVRWFGSVCLAVADALLCIAKLAIKPTCLHSNANHQCTDVSFRTKAKQTLPLRQMLFSSLFASN